QRVVDRANHVIAVTGGACDVFPNAATIGRQRIFLQQTLLAEASQNSGQSARVIKFFHQILARRQKIDERRDVFAIHLPVVEIQIHADTLSNRFEVNDGVGGAADGGVGSNGIDKGFAGEN